MTECFAEIWQVLPNDVISRQRALLHGRLLPQAEALNPGHDVQHVPLVPVSQSLSSLDRLGACAQMCNAKTHG